MDKKKINICESTYKEDDFHGKKPTGKKGLPGYSFTYKWTEESAKTAGAWCYIKTYMPEKGFTGGLILSYKNDNDTNLMLKIYYDY